MSNYYLYHVKGVADNARVQSLLADLDERGIFYSYDDEISRIRINAENHGEFAGLLQKFELDNLIIDEDEFWGDMIQQKKDHPDYAAVFGKTIRKAAESDFADIKNQYGFDAEQAGVRLDQSVIMRQGDKIWGVMFCGNERIEEFIEPAEPDEWGEVLESPWNFARNIIAVYFSDDYVWDGLESYEFLSFLRRGWGDEAVIWSREVNSDTLQAKNLDKAVDFDAERKLWFCIV